MTIKEKLEKAMRDAMRAGDEVAKRTIRMAVAAIRQIEIDRQIQLDDAGILAVLQKEVKTRRETIEEAGRAGRQDIIGDTEAEITVLNAYLPQQLSAEELTALVQAAIKETGAQSPADMGRVMKAVMPRIQGRASGDQVSQAVRQLLQTSSPE